MHPNLPPNDNPPATRRCQVVNIAKAVARNAAVPLLDPVKRRMYMDWMRGLRPVQLQTKYRCPVFGRPKVNEIDDILRGQAVLERMANNFKEAA